jgi:uncharacterized phiE125 gp8 family phage protein
MPAILLSGPLDEPVTVDEAKAYLRVETADDDDVIAALIAGARVHVEAQTRRALITQIWRLVRDAWPDDGRIAVLPAPLRTLTAARVYRLDGSTQSIDPSDFVADTSRVPAVLSFVSGAPPAPGRAVAGIELEIEVGYGDTEAVVPADMRHAIRLLVAHWYENRGLIATGGAAAMLPETVNALLAPYRVLSL